MILSKNSKESQFLTAQEELELIKKAQNGNKDAQSILITKNLPFIKTVAKKYKNRGLEYEDLIQEGIIGLLTAIRKFDTTRNLRLLSFGVWWIKQNIGRACIDGGRTIRLPANIYSNLSANIPDAISLNNPAHINSFEDNSTLLDTIDDSYNILNPTNSIDASTDFIFNEQIHDMISTILTPREERIVSLLYGFDGNQPLTLREASDVFCLSRERIRQIKLTAEKKLRGNKKFTENFNSAA